MKWHTLLNIAGGEPVFSSGILLTEGADDGDVRKQLSRWTASGRLWQLRRGVYTLAPPYSKSIPHPYLVANRLRPNSYVSLESALEFHGMIPEAVPVTTSVTTGRPEELANPLGRFLFRHIDRALFADFDLVSLPEGQQAFVATPEKALLDLIHLTPGGERLEYLRQLRLQFPARFNRETLVRIARESGRPKLLRAAKNLGKMMEEEGSELK